MTCKFCDVEPDYEVTFPVGRSNVTEFVCGRHVEDVLAARVADGETKAFVFRSLA